MSAQEIRHCSFASDSKGGDAQTVVGVDWVE